MGRKEQTRSSEAALDRVHFKCDPDTEHLVPLIKKVLLTIGLPLDNIPTISIRWQGQYGDRKNSHKYLRIGFRFVHEFNSLVLSASEIDSEKTLAEDLAHELAHANTPFSFNGFRRNDKVFGSRKERLEAQKFVMELADQLYEAEMYLNEYHKELAGHLSSLLQLIARMFRGRFTKHAKGQLYYDEVWAILVQLRMTNPDLLVQTEQALKDFAAKKGSPKKPISIMTPEGSAKPEGIDRFVIDLLSPSVTNLDGLEAHIQKIRALSDSSYSAEQIHKIFSHTPTEN